MSGQDYHALAEMLAAVPMVTKAQKLMYESAGFVQKGACTMSPDKRARARKKRKKK